MEPKLDVRYNDIYNETIWSIFHLKENKSPQTILTKIDIVDAGIRPIAVRER